jgi:hypothetical protein
VIVSSSEFIFMACGEWVACRSGGVNDRGECCHFGWNKCSYREILTFLLEKKAEKL